MRRARAARPLAALAPELDGLDALEAAARVARPDARVQSILNSLNHVDRARLVVDVYESRVAESPEKKAKGVFYTPSSVVESMLDRVPLTGTILDPAAGAGAFVLALARRLGLEALERIHANDVDADALAACALALEAAFGAGARDRIERWRRTNTHVSDFLRDPFSLSPSLIVGNPPYGLTDDGSLAKRFPALQGEIDLYACFVLRALEHVAPGGTVALLVPDTWLTNERAQSLRNELIRTSGVARVVDFGKPFATARDTRVHALVLQREASRCEVESLRNDVLVPMAPRTRDELRTNAARGWFLYRTTDEARACRTIERGRPLSETFDVLYGLRTGNNARHVARGPGALSLIGGLDFEAFDRHVAPKHLVHGEAFARTVAKQQNRWKTGIQRIRTNSRIPWRRWVEAALLEPHEVGLDSLTLVAARSEGGLSDDLCALLGVLNSSVLNRWYRLTFTDVNVKPVYVATLPLPELGADLATLVRKRLDSPGNVHVERAIDRLVAHGYGLSANELDVLERAFWADELANRPLPTLEEALRLARARAA